MYVWKLEPVLIVEMGVDNFVRKAQAAKLSSVWIKIANGQSIYPNLTGRQEATFRELHTKLHNVSIDVWGWHVPKCATTLIAQREANLVADIANDFNLDGILMDAESGTRFFNGGQREADEYAKNLRELLDSQDRSLAISSHDIPTNFPDFPFDVFASYARINVPQVYYGGSPSVENRLNRAISANSHLELPFVPVGAGWIGDGGGCASASACAERARSFIDLVHRHQFPGYSFWHWQGVPNKLWELLMTIEP